MLGLSLEVGQMSDLDIRALEANFNAWRSDRAATLPEDKAFERYTVDQILKDQDVSDEEVATGDLGGSDDGGIDAAYLFINNQLIRDETAIPEPATVVELVLVQASREKGFKEERV